MISIRGLTVYGNHNRYSYDAALLARLHRAVTIQLAAIVKVPA